VRSSKRRFVLGRLFHGSASHLQCLECLECLDKKTTPRRLAKTFPTLQPGLAFLTAMRSKDPSTQDTTTRVARAARVACFFDKNWCKWSEAKIGKAMCETFKVWSTPGRSLHRQRPKSHHWSRCIGQRCKVSVAEYDIWLFLQWKNWSLEATMVCQATARMKIFPGERSLLQARKENSRWKVVTVVQVVPSTSNLANCLHSQLSGELATKYPYAQFSVRRLELSCTCRAVRTVPCSYYNFDMVWHCDTISSRI